ncbi:MAG: stage III sporulation protein AG [Oscillospiraceae bacterium]|jgi:stage III sporulation protein AG|nr:stage III sporulation protein AG [Oscillospiraceae bacterium]
MKAFEYLKKKGVIIALAVIVLGVGLVSLPTGGKTEMPAPAPVSEGDGDFSLAETEKRIADALSKLDGAGRVEVVLTLKTGTETVYATDKTESERETSEKTVTVSQGGNGQSPVTLRRVYPEFRGALVLSDGADNADVRLALLNAVSGLTGLSSNKITVIKMRRS